MSGFNFYHPMEVRYGDIDAQGHLNNASFLTFFEQARIQYLVHLGLFDPQHSFMEVGVIVADIHIAYRKPVLWGAPIKVGVRTSKLGNKSMIVSQVVADAKSGDIYAEGEVVLVTFDYKTNSSMPIPASWREKIQAFESLEGRH